MASKPAIVIRVPNELHLGLKMMVEQDGESAGVIIRGLLRGELAKRGIVEADIRRIEDRYGIGADPAPRAIAPIGRADK
jgi:hypothetical protein